ncbi:hypothetical protein HMPREF0758_2846 [Serratia odorifera DSM 4582]|uniref:Uncharacterized protein n=1 Tax=Serratia odorifera DSM 4582 TaxID=667129 RepID=D4E3U6_SEROD|nr:hypothetical protein HMPREF0758_2846 [Serratia odorifera DSM 4582]
MASALASLQCGVGSPVGGGGGPLPEEQAASSKANNRGIERCIEPP